MKDTPVKENNNQKKDIVKLSSTSALVLLWAKHDCYQTSKAQLFLEKLDLEAGQYFYKKVEQDIWQHYSEVIKNRKYGIFQYVKKHMQKNLQIIIAGAGFDPLSIEILSIYPNVTIFEIDRENMEQKFNLAEKCLSAAKIKKLNCITCDLEQEKQIEQKLIEKGWDKNCPTLFIFEGISYYLSAKNLKQLVFTVNPDYLIIEFLKPSALIKKEYAAIPNQVFSLIKTKCDLPNIETYYQKKLNKNLKPYEIIECLSMKDLEYKRTTKNKFFTKENSGWIEVAMLAKKIFKT